MYCMHNHVLYIPESYTKSLSDNKQSCVLGPTCMFESLNMTVQCAVD